MPNFRIVENEKFSLDPVSTAMFGANYVTQYDFEFARDVDLANSLASIGIQTLRFPGGSVTEGVFADVSFLTGNWSADTYRDQNGNTRNLTPLSEFFDVAEHIGAGAQLVIPTRVAFQQSAGQALSQGTYGSREGLDPHYLRHVKDFIDQSLKEAKARGVEITGFEIGNEFWGSGEMTAAEYGHLAGTLSVFLDRNYPGIDIVVQVAASANRYSPSSNTKVFLEPDGTGDFTVHITSAADAAAHPDWIPAMISGSGNAAMQTQTIADEIRDIPRAAGLIDGIAGHVYFDAGFDGIDHQRDFALNSVRNIFSERLGHGDIDYFITEWSARNPLGSDPARNLGNANGLQYAQSTVEAFFELVSNGVHSANFWPTTFGSPGQNHRTLIDTARNDLTVGGIVFQWLAESTIGQRALFDFEVDGQIDVHGFGRANLMTLFAGSRVENIRAMQGESRFNLDLGEFAPEGNYFVTKDYLSSDDGHSDSRDSHPVIESVGGTMSSGPSIALRLGSGEIARIEVQLVGAGADRVIGGDGSDRISGYGGNDILQGSLGDDTIRGNQGADKISGGSGNDILYGGSGNDRVLGGQGNDVIRGGSGRNSLYGGDGKDRIYAEGHHDYIDGGRGDDVVFLQAAADPERELYAFNAGSEHQVGTDVMLSVDGHELFNVFIEGGQGFDTLRLGNSSEVLFLDDRISNVHADRAIAAAQGGRGSGVRLANIERIEGRGGNDIIDLTSDTFRRLTEGLLIDGGSGNDTIWGSEAGEEIIGGSGRDVIFGGAGSDTLTGGSGADIFEFTRTSTESKIVDFDPSGGDLIRFYNRGDAVFNSHSAEMRGDVFSIDYRDLRTGEIHELHIDLHTDHSQSISNETINQAIEIIG